jgi:hypothetical protein
MGSVMMHSRHVAAGPKMEINRTKAVGSFDCLLDLSTNSSPDA